MLKINAILLCLFECWHPLKDKAFSQMANGELNGKEFMIYADSFGFPLRTASSQFRQGGRFCFEAIKS